MAAPIRETNEVQGRGVGEEFRRVAEGVAAERRWSAVARRWSHHSLARRGPLATD